MGTGTSVAVLAARGHRRFLAGGRWVAITGSVGKTTTTRLVAAVLALRGKTFDGTQVAPVPVKQFAHAMLRSGFGHAYGVAETGAVDLGRRLSMVQPDIGIVTKVGSDHRTRYRTLEKTAEVKGAVVRCLPRSGVAILNADDPLVWAMRRETAARVIGCGRSADADLRIEDVSGDWPETMTLRVRHGSETVAVRTRLLGDYAAFPVAAALATGLAEGIPLAESAAAVATVGAVPGRMEPVATADGITFIDNAFKTPYYAVDPMLDFVKRATAKRKVIVFGAISDYPGASSARYRAIARKALDVADLVVFSGRWAMSVMKLREAATAGQLFAFNDTAAAREGLRTLLRPGDLVVLQGSEAADHFDRIVLDRTGRVDCWSTSCRLWRRCITCERLTAQA